MKTFNLSGEKLSKNALQIHLVGTLDELNAYLGLVKVRTQDNKEKKFLETMQINLMRLMSHVSDISNKEYFFTEKDTAVLKERINSLKEIHSGLSELVVPGKNETDAFIHIARTAARKAERYYTAVNEQTPLCKYAASYLNKVSNYLFYLSHGIE